MHLWYLFVSIRMGFLWDFGCFLKFTARRDKACFAVSFRKKNKNCHEVLQH